MFRLAIAVLLVCATSGRKFQNPVSTDRDYRSPGVLLYRGQYYAVTSSDDNNPDKFPIQVSTDLQNWSHAGYAIPRTYIPTWSNGNSFWYAELHQIGESDFRLFFSGYTASGREQVGVGYSQNVLGPYIVTNQPLVVSNAISYAPTMVQDGTRKYLIWSQLDGPIIGRELNDNCLGFVENSQEKSIISYGLSWEGNRIEEPWYVSRPDGWYMFYTGYSSNGIAVGVARGQHPFGPFEKHGDPILDTNYAFKGPGKCSVVPDIFNGATVMVYQADLANSSTSPHFMMVQSIEWGADGWPYMNPY